MNYYPEEKKGGEIFFILGLRSYIYCIKPIKQNDMQNTHSLAQQIEIFKSSGQPIASDGKDTFHGFYDWFCSDRAFEAKGKKLMNQVIKFVAALPHHLDTRKCYVFFKNNCPMSGPLYDSFSICDIESGDVLYWVTGKSGHTGEAECFSRATGFSDPMATGKNFTELLKNLK